MFWCDVKTWRYSFKTLPLTELVKNLILDVSILLTLNVEIYFNHFFITRNCTYSIFDIGSYHYTAVFTDYALGSNRLEKKL